MNVLSPAGELELDRQQQKVIYELTLKKQRSKKSTMSQKQVAAMQQLASELVSQRKDFCELLEYNNINHNNQHQQQQQQPHHRTDLDHHQNHHNSHQLCRCSESTLALAAAAAAANAAEAELRQAGCDLGQLGQEDEQNQRGRRRDTTNSSAILVNGSTPVPKGELLQRQSSTSTIATTNSTSASSDSSACSSSSASSSSRSSAGASVSASSSSASDLKGQVGLQIGRDSHLAEQQQQQQQQYHQKRPLSPAAEAALRACHKSNGKPAHQISGSHSFLSTSSSSHFTSGGCSTSASSASLMSEEAATKLKRLRLEQLNNELERRLHQYEYLVAQERAILGKMNLPASEGVNNFHLFSLDQRSQYYK